MKKTLITMLTGMTMMYACGPTQEEMAKQDSINMVNQAEMFQYNDIDDVPDIIDDAPQKKLEQYHILFLPQDTSVWKHDLINAVERHIGDEDYNNIKKKILTQQKKNQDYTIPVRVEGWNVFINHDNNK
jgi:hypothetical protein